MKKKVGCKKKYECPLMIVYGEVEEVTGKHSLRSNCRFPNVCT